MKTTIFCALLLVLAGSVISPVRAENPPSRPTPLLSPRQAGMARHGGMATASRPARAAARSLFDGKTLEGWIDQENNAGALSITN